MWILKATPLIVLALLIDLLQFLISLALTVMAAFPAVFAGCAAGSAVAGEAGCAVGSFLGGFLTLVPGLNVIFTAAAEPFGIAVGFAISICISFTLGSILVLFTYMFGILNRKAVVMACIGETLPGFSILPTWTAMVVGCIYMAYKQAAKSKLLGVATSVAGNLQLPDNSIGEAVEAGNQALLSQVLAQGTQARDFEEDASQENAAPLAMQDIRVSKQLNRDRIGAAAKTRPSYVKTT
jgi:hypothetical protein